MCVYLKTEEIIAIAHSTYAAKYARLYFARVLHEFLQAKFFLPLQKDAALKI